MDFDSQNKILKYNNPIDCIEDFVYKYEADVLRDSPNDLTLSFKGLWRSYSVFVKWDEFNKIINLSSCFEVTSKNNISSKVHNLISKVNERVNLGYFSFNEELEKIFFNYKISIRGIDFLTIEQIEDFLDVVIKECEKFFPVFYVFLKRKQNPDFALNAALIDTHGEA